MKVSGYKTDRWLVKTVSILLMAIAIAMILTTTSKQVNVSISILALLVAIGMAYVDFYYALNNTIWDIYMADGAVEILFAISWLIVLIKKNFTQRRKVE